MYMVKSSYVLLVLYLSIIKSTVAPMKMCSDQDFKKKKNRYHVFLCPLGYFSILSSFRHHKAKTKKRSRSGQDSRSAETQDSVAFGHVAHTPYLEIPHMVLCFKLFLYLFIFALCFECVFPCHGLNLFIKFGKTAKK